MFNRVLNTPLNLMSSFFHDVQQCLKGKHLRWSLYFVKLSAWGCNFTNARTLSQLVFCAFSKIFHEFFGKMPQKNHTLYLRPLVMPHNDSHSSSQCFVVPRSGACSASQGLVIPLVVLVVSPVVRRSISLYPLVPLVVLVVPLVCLNITDRLCRYNV